MIRYDDKDMVNFWNGCSLNLIISDYEVYKTGHICEDGKITGTEKENR